MTVDRVKIGQLTRQRAGVDREVDPVWLAYTIAHRRSIGKMLMDGTLRRVECLLFATDFSGTYTRWLIRPSAVAALHDRLRIYSCPCSVGVSNSAKRQCNLENPGSDQWAGSWKSSIAPNTISERLIPSWGIVPGRVPIGLINKKLAPILSAQSYLLYA